MLVPQVDVTGAHVDPVGPLGVRGVANVPQVDPTCAHVDPAAPLGIQGVANVPQVDLTGAHVDPAGPLGVRGVANVPQVDRICRMGRILVRYVHQADARTLIAPSGQTRSMPAMISTAPAASSASQ